MGRVRCAATHGIGAETEEQVAAPKTTPPALPAHLREIVGHDVGVDLLLPRERSGPAGGRRSPVWIADFRYTPATVISHLQVHGRRRRSLRRPSITRA
mmetsp:Transcript_28281/g.88127  ORF Transcript_28281/g.88127 Transcript_28281/m.88127 type:complete len:98 (-) Transcript_28281:146-439(-)